jgi:hypothetical protein
VRLSFDLRSRKDALPCATPWSLAKALDPNVV